MNDKLPVIKRKREKRNQEEEFVITKAMIDQLWKAAYDQGEKTARERILNHLDYYIKKRYIIVEKKKK